MITFTLVAILGVLLVIVLMNLFKKDPKPLPAPVRPVEDLANLKVTDARTGDVLSIVGAGDRMTDLDFTVDRGTRYEAGARTWVELSGPYQDRRVSLRVGGDEEIEVFLHADPRKITLEDLGAQRRRPGADGRAPESGRLVRFRQRHLDVPAEPRSAGLARQSAYAHRLLLLGIFHPGREAPVGNPKGRRRAVYRHVIHVAQRGRRHGLPQELIERAADERR